jgi:multisubunit Na+/H+ antiporter MnhE subunit
MSAQSKSPPGRVARHLGIVLFSWLALAAVWMLLVDNESLPELLTGAGVVCIATVGSELVRHQRIAEVRARPLWLLRLWKPVARVPVDVGIVTWALFRQVVERRRERGALRAMRFRADGKDPIDNARRALAELAGSMAPNTIVIGVDTRRKLILVHQLEPGGSAEDVIDPLELR